MQAGLQAQLEELGWEVDFDEHQQFDRKLPESDPPIGKILNTRSVSKACLGVSKVVEEHIKRGKLPLTLGGDHSLVGVCFLSHWG